MIELTKREAERVFGVGARHLRRMVRDGQIQRVERDGRVLYGIDSERLRKAEHRRRMQEWMAKQQGEKEHDAAPGVGEGWAKTSERERGVATKRKVILDELEAKITAGSARTRRAVREVMVGFVKEKKAQGARLSNSTLYTWRRLYRERGIEGLLPGYEKSETTIPADAIDIFLKHWLNQNRPSVPLAYEFTKAEYHGEKPLPGISAFYRLARSIPEPTKVLHRLGEKAFDDRCGPFVDRDYKGLRPNEIWCCDHHRLDVIALSRFGRPVRPWLTLIIDLRTRKAVGWFVSDLPPNTDAILAAWRRAVLSHGICEHFYCDNGRDFKSFAA